MKLQVQVTKRTAEAEGIVGFEFKAASGGQLPAFTAGAHIDVLGPAGHVRQYSLCNSPSERHRYMIAVLREPSGRGGSRAMHDQAKEGDILSISPPINHFALDESAPQSLLLAGGIGITPILAMAERLHALGRTFMLRYATSSMLRMAFRDRLRNAPFASSVRFHLGDGAADQKLDLARALKRPTPQAQLYLCGPGGFVDSARAAAADSGWPAANVHFECFTGYVPHASDGRHFDVVLKTNGRVIRVQSDQTVTEALEAHGVHVPTSCGQGVCGTCLTRVLEGVIDHRDLYLSPDEQLANDQFLPCCSRAKSSRLVLDL